MNTDCSAILAEYVTWLETLGYGESFVYGCKIRIHDFFDWLEYERVYNITQLTHTHIRSFYNHLETRQNKIFEGRLLGTMQINRYAYAIDKLLEFLHQYGMTGAPVPLNYRIKTDKEERINKIEVLTQQEIKTLYACIPDTYPDLPFEERQAKQYELKLIITLCYGCGLRRSEASNLCIQDVDFDRKTIFVRQGKNYKDRVIPMSAGVYKELQDYIYNFRHKHKLNHNRLFINKRGALHYKLKYLQRNCNDENIKSKRITLHLLRHSIATHLLQNGMSIENIALFLGHSSLDSTQIYTHLA